MVRITIELEQDELVAARAFIEALRAITDNVRVQTASIGSQSLDRVPAAAPVNAVVVGPASTAVTVTSISHAPTPSPPQIQQTPGNVTSVFASILQTLTDTFQLNSVVGSLQSALSKWDFSTSLPALVDALEAILTYDPNQPTLTLDVARIERYLLLLNHKLSEPYDTDLRKQVLTRVIKQMSKAREVTCDRSELWPWAVAFAYLVRLECIKISGALQLIERQCAKSTAFAATITMLGNVLVLCGQQVCNCPSEQLKVWTVLDSSADFQHPCFAADRSFFNSWRSAVQVTGEPPTGLKYQPWTPTALLTHELSSGGLLQPNLSGNTKTLTVTPAVPTALTTGSSAASVSSSGAAAIIPPLAATAADVGPITGSWAITLSSMLQLSMNIATVAWDIASLAAVVSGTNGSIGVYDPYTGVEKARLASPAENQPVDILCADARRPGQLLMVANPPSHSLPSASPPFLALFDSVATHSVVTSLTTRCAMSRRNVTSITSALIMPHDADVVVSCEVWPASTSGTSTGHDYPVCLWSAARLGGHGPSNQAPFEMKPLHLWKEGDQPVRCACASTLLMHTLYTGSGDGVVRLWDTRMHSPAGSLRGSILAPQPAHAAAATGLAPPGIVDMDCQNHTLVTAGTDSTVYMWDVRNLGGGHPMIRPLQVASQGVRFYKLVYRDSPSPSMAAVALGTGLFLLDWTQSSCTLAPFPGYHDPSGNVLPANLLQHDIEWAAGCNVPTLISVGSQSTLCAFQVRPA